MVILGSRSLGIAAVLAMGALLGCAPAPRPSAMMAANQASFTPLSPERAVGSVVIVLPSRALVEREVWFASGDHRPRQIAADIDRTEAETLLLAETAQAARLFDQVSFLRADRPEDAAISDSDYRIWAEPGGDSFLWYLDGPRGSRTAISFDRVEDFPAASFAAVRRLGGQIQEGVGAPMIRIGDNRIFQTPLTPTQEQIVIEIHDKLLPKYRQMIMHHVMASKVFKKYEPIVDARAKLYCAADYSIGFDFIGRRLIYPAIDCRVYCE